MSSLSESIVSESAGTLGVKKLLNTLTVMIFHHQMNLIVFRMNIPYIVGQQTIKMLCPVREQPLIGMFFNLQNLWIDFLQRSEQGHPDASIYETIIVKAIPVTLGLYKYYLLPKGGI